jgi:hypothetical protein
MEVQFPLFVFEKDDRSMYLIESPERVFHHLEAIDIENGEYLFWDSTGAGVCVGCTWKGKTNRFLRTGHVAPASI